eukprot:353182-Chlamydomonas_euryale.AAC.28
MSGLAAGHAKLHIIFTNILCYHTNVTHHPGLQLPAGPRHLLKQWRLQSWWGPRAGGLPVPAGSILPGDLQRVVAELVDRRRADILRDRGGVRLPLARPFVDRRRRRVIAAHQRTWQQELDAV